MLKFAALFAAVHAKTIIFQDSQVISNFDYLKSLFGRDIVLAHPIGVSEPLSNFQTVVLVNITRFGYREDRNNKYKNFEQELQHAQQTTAQRKRYDFSYQKLLDFVDNGGNLIILAENPHDEGKKLVSELGMEFAETGDFSASKTLAPVVSGEITGKLQFSGKLNFAQSNDLVFPVIQDFVGALQARNGARALVVHSLSVFSDKSLKTNDANKDLLKELIAWGSGNKAVLRTRDLKHHLVGQTQRPYMYRMSDDISFSIVIEEYKQGTWSPYVADDVQLEYTMIDPYLRQPLVYKDGRYNLTFKAPDVYGVFKFVVDYKRKGYTHIKVEEQAALRNFKHSDYERFIFSAYPHYATCFASAAAVAVFAAFFVFGAEVKLKEQ